MKKILYIVSFFPILPTVALAQTLSAQGFITGFLAFTNSVLIPFLLGFAFLFFIFNAFRFFIVNGGNEDGQKNAKNLAVYGVLAFVVLVVFWGVVNLLASSVGFNKGVETTPDYVEKNGGDFKSIAPRSPSDNSAATTLPTKPASGRPINLPPPEYGGTEDNFADCGNGQSFDSKGNPCGIY